MLVAGPVQQLLVLPFAPLPLCLRLRRLSFNAAPLARQPVVLLLRLFLVVNGRRPRLVLLTLRVARPGQVASTRRLGRLGVRASLSYDAGPDRPPPQVPVPQSVKGRLLVNGRALTLVAASSARQVSLRLRI